MSTATTLQDRYRDNPAHTVRLLALRELIVAIAVEVEELVPRPDRVQVIEYDPGIELRDEAIFVIDVEGDVESEFLAGGIDQATEDSFTVTLLARAGGAGHTGPSSMARADSFYQAVRNVVLGAELGHDLDDLGDDDGPGVISDTVLGRVDGPLTGPDDLGFLGLYRIEVTITTNEVSA